MVQPLRGRLKTIFFAQPVARQIVECPHSFFAGKTADDSAQAEKQSRKIHLEEDTSRESSLSALEAGDQPECNDDIRDTSSETIAEKRLVRALRSRSAHRSYVDNGAVCDRATSNACRPTAGWQHGGHVTRRLFPANRSKL